MTCRLRECYNIVMDKKILTLLLAIDKASPNGESVILEKKELIDNLFPGKSGVDEVVLLQLVKELALGGYIKLVYTDERVICVAALPKGLLVAEETKADSNLAVVKKETESKVAPRGKLVFAVFWAAFAGSAAGGGLLYLILRLAGLS